MTEREERSIDAGHWISRLFASSNADTFVDITAGFERKLAARFAHKSQTTDPLALAAGWRERAAAIGSPADLALAEAFTRLYLH